MNFAIFEVYSEHADVFVKITGVPDESSKRRCVTGYVEGSCPICQYLEDKYPEININWKNGEAEIYECDENSSDFMIDITVSFDEIMNYCK